MKRPLALLAVALFAGLPMVAGAQPRPRKIFISVDMEGISGVVDPAQLGPEGFEYQRARDHRQSGKQGDREQC